MINVFGSQTGQEEKDAVAGCLDRRWMGIGPKVAEFEKEFAARRGLSNFVMLDSGSNALYMAIKLLDLTPGSEVIVPSFTWVSCAQAVVLAGHKVVFCDVSWDTQNVTAPLIERKMTPKTGAIMVVHYAGLPCEMDEIKALGLPIVEDAAHAVNSVHRGVPTGMLGDVAIFSFDAVKNLATPEGGGLCAKNPELADRARKLRYCGIESSGFGNSTSKDRWWEYNIVDFFPKCLPNDVNASIGLAQLRKLEYLQGRRWGIWDTYQRELANIDWILTPREPPPYQRHSYFTYFIRVRSRCFHRNQLAHYLKENGVYSTLRYHPLHLNPIYGPQERLHNCEALNEEGLNLPLHPGMTEEDVDKVVSLLKSYKK